MSQYFSLLNRVDTEDLVKKAILSPFCLDQCQKIAESQCNGTHSIRQLGILRLIPASQLFWMTSLA
jgi:hypothetical protein